MKFYDIPEELILVQMEERCIALRQPFFQIRELPNGGQKSIKGNVVNVPMDVSKTINQLPRNLNETETIGIKFKKKVSYKKCDYYENIRPKAVIKAARYLINNSDIYKAHNVRINETWEESIVNNTDENLKVFVDSESRNKAQTGNNSCPNIMEKDLPISDKLPNKGGNSCPNIIEIDLTTSDNEDSLPKENDGPCAKIMKRELSLTTNKLPNPSGNSCPNIIEIDLSTSDEEYNDQVTMKDEKTGDHTHTSRTQQMLKKKIKQKMM